MDKNQKSPKRICNQIQNQNSATIFKIKTIFVLQSKSKETT
jgi:hypothetical protein